MELFGLDIFGLFQNPAKWIGIAVGSVAFLPIATVLLDYVTQAISDTMVEVNVKMIDKIPVVPLRDWLQNRQILMLKNSIASYQCAIKKIKGK